MNVFHQFGSISKIDEVDAVLGGESSGGLTVRGHIHGKDSVYAAALFAENRNEEAARRDICAFRELLGI